MISDYSPTVEMLKLSRFHKFIFGFRAPIAAAEPNLVSARKNASSRRQIHLPALPVPPLGPTLAKYLRTVIPHLTEAEFSVTRELVERFGSENGVGPKLQQLLEQRASMKENWLSEWWLHSAYLDFRWPVVVHSSPGLVFPQQVFRSKVEQLDFAAKLVLASVSYKLLIDDDGIPLERMGKDPLDMSQYAKIFGTCRIPGLTRDSLKFHPKSKHIVVAHNNHFFKITLWNQSGELLSRNQLLQQLKAIVVQSETKIEPVGVLTTENRNVWGQAYNQIKKDSVINESSLEAIEESLFLVCIDGPMNNLNPVNDQTEAGMQFIHGGGSANNAGNRWYDKTVQFVIGHDGLNGLTYEHSPSEGQPIATMTDYLVNYIAKNQYIEVPEASYTENPEELHFKVSTEMQRIIDDAKNNIDNLVDDLDMNCFTFKHFGKEFVKSQKLSPDSFIQMAIQLAFYRIHKVAGAHYESAATRKFNSGRTETIRSCSVESVDFARAMLDPTKSEEEKVANLKRAIDCHKKYTVDALNGFGVDRHLLGLKLTAIENGFDVPKIYLDAGFVKSAHMRLSTSQVATKCDGFMCYGPLVPDGYACCYNPRENQMNFGISAFNSSPETSAARFRQALEDSLLDMQRTLLKSHKAKL